MDLIQTLVNHFHIAPGLQGRTELGRGEGRRIWIGQQEGELGKRELYEILLPREQYVILLPATQGQQGNPHEFKRYTM